MPQEDPALPRNVGGRRFTEASKCLRDNRRRRSLVRIGFGFILLHTMKPVAELVSGVDVPVSTVG